MFNKELLNSCKITAEEFSCSIKCLDKDKTYVVGYFQTPKGSVIVSYKNGLYCVSSEDEIQCSPYGFNSLSRAYSYFEELFYK